MEINQTLQIVPVTYYLSPTGNDSNNGLTPATSWLTPNHPVNCGDVILAAPSNSYVATNFRPGQWGVVTCPSANNVAWLKCAIFDTCKININSIGHNAMTPTQSYWGIQGWEVTASVLTGNQCFNAFPPDFTHTVHHIIFANNVANGCGDGAFTTGSSAPGVGVDYITIIGNIAYNGAQDSGECYSGIDIVTPVNSDTLPGTHIYIAGNFSWGNINPNPCAGGLPTDGQGISLDTVSPYTGQILVDNNISVFNGGSGIQSFLNNTGSPNALIYIRNNTTYGNQIGSINAFPCAEVNLAESLSTQVYGNLVQTGAATGCHGSVGIYTLGVTAPDGTDILYNNYGYSASGNDAFGSGPGFVFGLNTFGTNPNFVNPVEPGLPNCGTSTSVPECMSSVVANFTPRITTAQVSGYRVPNTSPVYDPLFPQWLCSVTNLPPNLITMGCLSSQVLPVLPSPSAQPSFSSFPVLPTNAVTGSGGVGQLFGGSLKSAVSNPGQLDLIQIIGKGGSIIWSMGSQGITTTNPTNPTSFALLARLNGSSFSDVFGSNTSDIFQVKNSNGEIVFWVDSMGVSHGS